MIRKCDCEHEYQDRVHGKGKRVHAPKRNGQWACTVCSKLKGK